MVNINELAVLLAGGPSKEALAEANPYLPFKGVADSLSPIITQAAMQPDRFSTRDTILAALASGLGSGIFGGLGKDYENTLTNRYSQAVLGFGGGNRLSQESTKLPSSLFGEAQHKGNLFETINALDTLELLKKSAVDSSLERLKARNDLINAAVKNGDISLDEGQRLLAAQPSEKEGPGAQATKPMIADSTLTSSENPDVLGLSSELGITPLDKRRADKYSYYRETLKMPPVQAATAAQKDLEGELEADAKSYGRVQEQRDKARTMLGMADTVDSVLDQGLQPGAGAEFGQAVSESMLDLGIGNLLGFDNERAALGQTLQSIKGQVMSMNRVVGSGSQSDMEAKAYLQGGPGLDKDALTNREMARRLREISNLNRDYTEFVDQIRNQGGTIQKADELWSRYERANPLWAKSPDGQLLPNPNRVSYRDFDFRTGAPKNQAQQIGRGAIEQPSAQTSPIASATAPTQKQATDSLFSDAGDVLRAYGRGIANTPQAIGNLFSSETYSDLFSSPEKPLEVVGKGASFTAGAVPGAALGATIGSVVPVVGTAIGGVTGGAIGGILGALGFDMATEAGSELAGVGTEKGIIPTKQDIEREAEGAGTFLGLGAIGKGVSSAAKGVTNLAKGAKGTTTNLVEGAQQKLLGIKPKDIEKVVAEGKVRYFDDLGNEVPLQDASQWSNALDKSSKIVQADGFFDEITNSPKANKLVFDKKMELAGKARGELLEQAKQGLNQIEEALTPIQRKQFPLFKDPKTGKGGFNPDFSNVDAVIRDLGVQNPRAVNSVKSAVNQVKARWEATSKSFDKLQEFKQLLGDGKTFRKPSNLTDSDWLVVKQELYKSFAKRQSEVFEFVMQKTNPEMVGSLKGANLLYHSYKNLETFMDKLGARGNPPLKIGTLGSRVIPSVLDQFPATKFKSFEQIARGGEALSQGAAGIESELSRLLGMVPDGATQALKAGVVQMGDSPQIEPIQSLFGDQKKKIGMDDSKPPITAQAPLKQDVALIEQEIDKDPYMSALYEAESGRNPKAKNPVSSASGAFQLINSTAKNLGVDDPFDIVQNYAGALKLTDMHRAKFGNDPATLYMAHYLGETVLRKLLNKQPLARNEQEQVNYLFDKALPAFMKIYKRKAGLMEA